VATVEQTCAIRSWASLLLLLLSVSACASEHTLVSERTVASERTLIRVSGHTPDTIVLGAQGVDPSGVMKITLPWTRFNVTRNNRNGCRIRSVSVFDGAFELRPLRPPLSLSELGSFPALLVVEDTKAPTITLTQAPTAVATVSAKLPRECLVPVDSGADLDAALEASAALIVATLPRRANAELALTYGMAQSAAGSSYEITPGMRLKIQTAELLAYQPAQSGSVQRFYLGPTNYVYPGLRRTPGGGDPGWELDLVAALADLGFNQVTPGEKNGPLSTVGGIQDLRIPPANGDRKTPKRYWRVYAPTMPLANNFGEVYTDPEELDQSFVIAATNQPASFPKEKLTLDACKQAVACLQPRARGVITPEIMIFVQGTPQWTWLGSTLGDVLNRFRPLIRSSATATAQSAAADDMLYSDWATRAWSQVQVWRQTWTGRAELVAPESASIAAVLSMPLVAGDVITW
jgi:hypothetical protein